MWQLPGFFLNSHNWWDNNHKYYPSQFLHFGCGSIFVPMMVFVWFVVRRNYNWAEYSRFTHIPCDEFVFIALAFCCFSLMSSQFILAPDITAMRHYFSAYSASSITFIYFVLCTLNGIKCHIYQTSRLSSKYFMFVFVFIRIPNNGDSYSRQNKKKNIQNLSYSYEHKILVWECAIFWISEGNTDTIVIL